MKKILSIISLLLLVILLAACSELPYAPEVEQEVETPNHLEMFTYDDIDYSQTEVLVRTTPDYELNSMLAKQGSEVLQEWDQIDWKVVSVPAGKD
ncbi:MAG: hypothetical protein ACLFUI_07475, partial [Halanaerobiales bacterium]